MAHHHHTHNHVEKHFTSSATVRDIVIGMSDGLTVPFALAAGISGAVDSSTLVITAGLAEIAAGSIAMGLGGYLSAKGEEEHYHNEQLREEREVREVPEHEEEEIYDILAEYGVSAEDSKPVVEALKRKPDKWVEFMMKFELGLEKPDPKRSLYSAITIGGSYIVGGIIPLLPYWFCKNVNDGLTYSCIATLIALAVFGYFKGTFTSGKPLRSSIQTVLIGGAAAGVAFGVAKLISH